MRYTEKEARELVIRTCHELVDNKLIARTWGNVSARISDTHFVITPSGKGTDTPQLYFCRCDCIIKH